MSYQLTAAKIWDGSAWVYSVGTAYNLEYLVVAGGGGGNGANVNYTNAGGGGAGGYRSNITGEPSGGGASAELPLLVIPGDQFTVTVGAGGNGGTYAVNAGRGGDSIFAGITSLGGGRGAKNRNVYSGSSESGGSGGGGSRSANAGQGEPGQGFAGGNDYNGGGGGGAGQVGQIPAGGAGVSSSITGSAIVRATGGRARGGIINGVANTGDGGAGATNSSGGAGGSGIVIFSVPANAAAATFTAGLTYTSATVGSKTVYTITAGTGTVTLG